MLAFEEKSVFEESGFPLEKEEQALKETSLKRGWIDAYRGKFLKKSWEKFFWKVDKVPLKKVKPNKTNNLILHKINYANFFRCKYYDVNV